MLFRPVVQDYLLPTLVYTGGAAEVAYFAQAAVVYEKLLGRVTPILPRFSATLVEAEGGAHSDALPTGSCPMCSKARKKFGKRLPLVRCRRICRRAFRRRYASVEQSMAALRESIGKLDSTLIDAAESARQQHVASDRPPAGASGAGGTAAE